MLFRSRCPSWASLGLYWRDPDTTTVGDSKGNPTTAGPHLLKVKRQRSSTLTLLLISMSYWFDKPRFINRGKTATSYISAFAWGTTQLYHHSSSGFLALLPGIALKLHKKTCPRQLCQCLSISIIKQFSGAVAGDFGATARGVSHPQSLYFVFVLLALFLV